MIHFVSCRRGQGRGAGWIHGSFKTGKLWKVVESTAERTNEKPLSEETVSGTLARRVVLRGIKGGGVVGFLGGGGALERVGEWTRKSEEEGEEREKEHPCAAVGRQKKILITRLLTAFTMTVYPTFLRANYLLLHESWRSFRLVAFAEHQQSSLTRHTQ